MVDGTLNEEHFMENMLLLNTVDDMLNSLILHVRTQKRAYEDVLRKPKSVESRNRGTTLPLLESPKLSTATVAVMTSPLTSHTSIPANSPVFCRNSARQLHSSVDRSPSEADSALTHSNTGSLQPCRSSHPRADCSADVNVIPNVAASAIRSVQPMSTSRSFTPSCSCFNTRIPDSVTQRANRFDSEPACYRCCLLSGDNQENHTSVQRSCITPCNSRCSQCSPLTDRLFRPHQFTLAGKDLVSPCHRQSTPHSWVVNSKLCPTVGVWPTPCFDRKPASSSTSGVLSRTSTRTTQSASCSCPDCHSNLTYYSLLLPVDASAPSCTASYTVHSAPNCLVKRRSLSLARPV
ncbi:hypothetical protein D915_006088 [Fasciola hepatica]|uniref:Uncharacterized protein n=1 Tax=Fasciola hepatica TaxID=6192 RepID=A0A4E0R4C8_FASHE|nr:hypothetical protein D915_006088 [Fasciola hepatica]